MRNMSYRLALGGALSVALLGIVGCMSEDDAGSVEGAPLAPEQAPHEDTIGDPDLAAAITEAKMATLGIDVISPDHHAPCGTIPPDDDATQTADAASPNAANQRTGSSTGCTILGVLQPSDDANYFCYTLANDNFTWTYLRNIRTGVRGWVRDDLLRDNGSFVHCNF